MPAPSEPLASGTRAFLRRYRPFDRMSDAVIDFAIERLSLAYFPKDAVILAPASGPVSHLHLIRRGVVGSRPEDPRLPADPALTAGELFPAGALSAGSASARI